MPALNADRYGQIIVLKDFKLNHILNVEAINMSVSFPLFVALVNVMTANCLVFCLMMKNESKATLALFWAGIKLDVEKKLVPEIRSI